MSTDLQTIKQAQRVTWGNTGDYNQIGKIVAFESELLCEAVGVQASHRVLDVATGTGNTALAAARRNSATSSDSTVTGVDFAPDLLEIARVRAAAEGLGITFDVGDAGDLPYPDDSFDLVLSTFGVMFVPGQEKVADELVRVCRPGGRIGLANWTPDSLIAEIQKTVGTYTPPPPGVESPVLWGSEERLKELFGDRVDLKIERRDALFHYLESGDFIDALCTYYGPVIKALEKLDESDQQRLISDMKAVAAQFARPVDGACELSNSYLQVVGTVR